MMFTDIAPIDRFVSRLLLRSTLSPDSRQALLQLKPRSERLKAHQAIGSVKGGAGYCCLVAAGMVGRIQRLQGGPQQVLSIAVPGDMCDLQTVILDDKRIYLEALTPSTVLLVPRNQLRQLAIRFPDICAAFWRDTIADASILSAWAVRVGRQDARARFAHLLCEIGLRLELSGLGTRSSFSLEITQADLADALGLTSVHLCRTLTVLRNSGVMWKRGEVSIADWRSLAKSVGFDPAYLLVPPQRVQSSELTQEQAAPEPGVSTLINEPAVLRIRPEIPSLHLRT